MSPTFSGSSALRDEIIFNFYPGLPHIVLLSSKGHLKAGLTGEWDKAILKHHVNILCACVWFLFSQSIRVKLVQNSSTVERKFSSWIGGSILASLVST